MMQVSGSSSISRRRCHYHPQGLLGNPAISYTTTTTTYTNSLLRVELLLSLTHESNLLAFAIVSSRKA
jgi:phosphopantetheinyl transferase (holo-ACP synthase)